MEPPTLYVPAEAVEDVRRLLLVMQRLDRGRMVCNLNGVKAGDEIELSREHVVTAFATTHTIPSLGYVVWERRFKLKEEYHGLPGEQIRDLRLAGTEVTREVRTPLVAYTGDTSPAGLDACPAAFEAKILITETELHPRQPPAREDPQVRPHAPGRLHGAGRPLQERADHLRPLQHALSPAGGAPRSSMPSCRRGCASASGCGCDLPPVRACARFSAVTPDVCPGADRP